MHVWGEVGVGSRNRRKLPAGQTRHGLWKYELRIEIGVVCTAAVPGPPACVQCELHEVGKPWLAARSGGRTAGQRAKLFETHGIRAFGSQVRVDKVLVSE